MNEDYEKKIYRTSIRPSLSGLLINSIYVFYFARLPYSSMPPLTTFLCIATFIIVVLFFQLLLFRFTNHLMNNKISIELSDIDNFNQTQRTDMALRLMKLPFSVCLHVAIMFLISGLTVISIYYFILDLPLPCILLTLIPTVFSAFSTGVMAFCDVESWCTELNYNLIQNGIDSEVVHDRKVFG